ncbi:hypothetical protein ASPWEDRAFT_72469 [Aspergillus wentii DTO 134E9]|uniref:Uncharacterized protein n=1 Tax=Aspergillus wentii DTO 134E9 TaxID=1073089 RepID=A0A1L9R9G5_ASPWE|nr:uncharacterized protein ASPWEDRAFT_72469 [Aspergillus wentii DTO 134E9]OJJ31562.1 hypothetical protein ASPWEDRAFT_72469 [Aspergillus wentii DTO 134E9]
MPPVVQSVGDFPGIPGRSILDLITNTTSSASPSSTPSSSSLPDQNLNLDARDVSSTIDDGKTLAARSDSTSTSKPISGQGTVAPNSIHMQGLLALFAIIGAAFVLAIIWFFFWAKNGGFIWRKGDWEDYKSTVLRRKGPNGETLSNATKSTKLGGGSIVHNGYSDDAYTYTESGLGYTDTATTITEKGEPKKKRRLKERFMRRRRDDDDDVIQEEREREDEDVLAYRQEKAARVGGMNREAEGTYHGSDYDTSNPPSYFNQSEMSEARDYAYHKPPRQSRQSRDFSFTPGTEDVLSQTTGDRETARASSTRRHNRRRERRRNPPPPSTSSRQSSPRKRERRSVHGHYTEPLDFSSAGTRSEYQYSNVETDDGSGTKSYHHPLGKGYRRDGGRSRRRDSLSDSDGEGTRYS